MEEWLSPTSKGRDLLDKMGASIFLEQGETQQMTKQSREYTYWWPQTACLLIPKVFPNELNR